MVSYINYIRTRIYLSFKTFLEYKSNFYAFLIADFFNLGILMVFFFVYSSLVEDLIFNWTLYDFLLFGLIHVFSVKLSNLMYLRDFNKFLIQGGLNLHLVKPISPYLAVLLNSLRSGRLIMTILYLIIIIFLISLFNYGNYFLAFVIWSVGFIGGVFISNILELFGFFMKGTLGLKKIRHNVKTVSRNFTFAPFEENFILSRIIFMVLPMSIISYFSFQVLNGDVKYFYTYIYPLTFYSIFLLFFHIYLWKKGLKKYEAFG